MDLPVVCTLSAEALAARRTGLLADLMRACTSRQDLADGLRLSFAGSDDVLARLAETIAAERRCCRFLRFQITVEPAEGGITLELTGPKGTQEFLTALLDG